MFWGSLGCFYGPSTMNCYDRVVELSAFVTLSMEK